MNKRALILSILLIPNLCFAPAFHGPLVDAIDIVGNILSNRNTKIAIATAKIASGLMVAVGTLTVDNIEVKNSKTEKKYVLPLKYKRVICIGALIAGLTSIRHGIADLIN